MSKGGVMRQEIRQWFYPEASLLLCRAFIVGFHDAGLGRGLREGEKLNRSLVDKHFVLTA